ncbi:uncharacterized protein BP01DRAFT_34979 [Aspergillus saccharolyticus JOP 1030-1]|uniref:Uncharacterized protein n=1 Tax=Aspergillus saccharolyticus JOP 1030-1 TaxID=1450539 RepID=A0A319A1A2_9EURO|nr:hypothetical protein BP01DRAFT_34979 [Aspergillus saccharolyticus JOP 1030-1]PYH46068.1 hypothetical protein BP01DRAFT_34979 [Aspergillus saccharolyticus JOP 1030-1]
MVDSVCFGGSPNRHFFSSQLHAKMVAPTIPSWLLPNIYSASRFDDSAPPSWHVVFICPMEDAERVAALTKLCSVDEDWVDRPSTRMRRLVEIPWLMDRLPQVSVIFDIINNDPLIFVDDQSRKDDTAIIAWKASKDSVPEAARVPFNRTNLLLSVVAGGGTIPSEYPRIVPEIKPERAIKAALPPHLAGLRLDSSTPTLISLIHLPAVVQENLKALMPHAVTIRNWPEHTEPCSHAQLYRMFQAIKISHPGIDEAFALFIDEDCEGYHVVAAEGASAYRSDPRDKRLSLAVCPFDKVQDFWTAAFHPTSQIPAFLPDGPYRYNPAMYSMRNWGGEPIVDPDDIAGSIDHNLIFILEAMTPSELRKIRAELFPAPDQEYMWVDVSDRLPSPDMQGLLAYFESEEFEEHPPPREFLAIDRKTLEVALEPADEREDWEAIIVASNEGGDVWFDDDKNRAFGHISTGYGYGRMNLEEAEIAHTNLSIQNMSWDELCSDGEVVYWSAYRTWAERNMGEETFARSFGPEGVRVARQ